MGQGCCGCWWKIVYFPYRSDRRRCVPSTSFQRTPLSITLSHESWHNIRPQPFLLFVLPTEGADAVIDLIHQHGMKCGVAISPHTPSSAITDAIGNKADMLLVMTVVPGRGGQKFMAECVPKVGSSPRLQKVTDQKKQSKDQVLMSRYCNNTGLRAASPFPWKRYSS